ncbi:MAG: response regulator [Spirochaetaceae bacterium]|nr:response regulator [Spirochaetaceae bacterium]
MDIAKKGRILLVDDDKTSLLVLMNILQQDYSLYIARDGEEAIKNAIKNIPDLILLDIILPDIDGYTVLARLRASDIAKDIPIIFVTGLSESGGKEKGLKLGAVDYIIKPFNPMEVKEKIMHHIEIINQNKP